MSDYNEPWHANIEEGNGFIITDSDGFVVCSFRSGVPEVDNAKLIAAAPEMLNILMDLNGSKEMFAQEQIDNVLNKVLYNE